MQLPTGGGKTAIASHMISSALSKGMDQWFVVNRQELIDQTARALYKMDIPFSYISNGYQYNDKKSVQICSIQTLHRRLQNYKKPKLIYWDECRMIASKTCSNVFWNNPDAYHIGLDATPCRLSGEPLGDYFSSLILGPTVRWLIENGYLCDYKIYAPPIDTSTLRIRAGEYSSDSVDELMNQKKILGNAVKEYKKHAYGKRNLVFCNSINHSKNLRAEFETAGIPTADIDGSMSDYDRRKTLEDFASGKILVLTSVNLVTAGYDLPSIECVTLERPTLSVAMAKQMIGRGLRTHENKSHLIILDHVNMWKMHGLPDEEYQWSLEGRKKIPKSSDEIKIKQCDKCYFVYSNKSRICPECGFEPEIKVRQTDIEGTDDELKELDIEAARISAQNKYKQERWQAQTKEELEEFGKKMGYKHARAWAHKVFQARQRKKLGK